MRSEPLISIIIPLYNGGTYLRDCLESVISQSYRNMEIIIIDDGSTDGSLELSQEYASKDSRITIRTQLNSGVAAARNNGVSISKGDYFFFLDADDFLFPSTIEKLYRNLMENDADMSICNTCANSGNKVISYYKKDVVRGSDDVLTDALNCKYKYLSVWGILYKTAMFKNLKFQNYRLCEDELYSIEAILIADKISFVSEALYFYRNNQGSASHTKDPEFFLDGYKAAMKFDSIIEEQKSQYSDISKCRLLNHTFFAYFKIRKAPGYESEKSQLIATIKNNRNKVIKNKKADIKIKLISMLSYAGFGFLAVIYSIYSFKRK